MPALGPGYASASAGRNPMILGDTITGESDWEYEHDDNETEDYYFTLDVTTNQPQLASMALKRKHRNRRPTVKASETGVLSGNPLDEPDSSILPRAMKGGRDASASKSTRSVDIKLQVIDLHTENPLVKFDDALYSCNWSTDIGTQFYVAQPGVAEQPLRPGKALDIIGLSRTRLVGIPATMRQQKSDTKQPCIGASTSNAISVDDNDDSEVDMVSDTPNIVLRTDTSKTTKREAQFAAVRRNTHDSAVKAQASFLERLSAIKRRKGETDTIPLNGIKQKDFPSIEHQSRVGPTPGNDRELNGTSTTGKNHKRASYKKRQFSAGGKGTNMHAEPRLETRSNATPDGPASPSKDDPRSSYRPIQPKSTRGGPVDTLTSDEPMDVEHEELPQNRDFNEGYLEPI